MFDWLKRKYFNLSKNEESLCKNKKKHLKHLLIKLIIWFSSVESKNLSQCVHLFTLWLTHIQNFRSSSTHPFLPFLNLLRNMQQKVQWNHWYNVKYWHTIQIGGITTARVSQLTTQQQQHQNKNYLRTRIHTNLQASIHSQCMRLNILYAEQTVKTYGSVPFMS